jgi:hypothetical protein
MAHKWALDSVERLLRDIREIDAPFGGVTMLFSGDVQSRTLSAIPPLPTLPHFLLHTIPRLLPRPPLP